MSKIRLAETPEPETPAADRIYIYLDDVTGVLMAKDDAGNTHVLTMSTGARYCDTEDLAAGISEISIDTTALALAAAPSQVLVTMEGADGDALLYPMVVGRATASIKVAWQAATVGTDYKLHWEIVV